MESAKLWYDHFRANLERNPVEMCIFNKFKNLDEQVTIGIHVDDQIITSQSRVNLESTITAIEEMFKETKVTKGRMHNYIGMTLDFTLKGKYKVKMQKYIEDKLKEYNVTGKSKTPSGQDLFYIDKSSQDLSEEETELFHSKIASLLFLAKKTRPDILLPVQFLSTRVMKPTVQDAHKLDKLLRYLNSTKHMCLTLTKVDVTSPWIYIDAAYGCYEDEKSHSDAVEGVRLSSFNYHSKKQKINTKSSTEAEIVEVSDMPSYAIYTRYLLQNQGYTLKPTKVYQDNILPMRLMDLDGNNSCNRTKHIDIRYY